LKIKPIRQVEAEIEEYSSYDEKSRFFRTSFPYAAHRQALCIGLEMIQEYFKMNIDFVEMMG